MSRWLYYLLVLAVIAPLVDLIWGPQQVTAIFVFSAIGLIPLAGLIGRATEDLEYHVGPIAGGLLNASFGNAPEIIIGFFAIQHGLITVVKASITGSIISNSLLVLGSSLAIGGWRWGKQYFSARDAGQYSTMMVLAVAGLLIPSTSSLVVKDPGHIQSISIAISIIMLFVYAMYLALHVFHVRSERRPRGEQEKTSDEELPEVEAIKVEAKQPPKLWLAILLLTIATIGTAINSELLVGAIEPITLQFGWSQVFIGLVIIPIVSNATEHSTALVIALKDRVDISMAITAGSSIQVATFVAPVLVLVSLLFPTRLNLVF
ncbi:MAG TPA: calcium/proton exchanger, partial [Ktedonobacteraceae bacterium]|nr:calcium/proton exchanger [Ktedonobacteraceae bacterium]